MTKEERLCAAAGPLLAWYDIHKRILPWRGTGDPYRVWVSEIMLQQTRVAAVVPYYLRWMEALPTVEALAEAEEDAVLRLWQGLGYYSRARNLRRAAQEIVGERGGIFPQSYEALRTLPGVGEYTAAAIASMAYGEAVPAVDGNLLRVAARVADIDGNILDGKVRREIRSLLEMAIPRERPGAFNQAMMDLGATVCTPGLSPECEGCPLSILCEAHRLGKEGTLPVRAGKPKRRVEELTVFVLEREGDLAFRRRPESGLLAGLWELPNVPGRLTEKEAAGVVETWGLTPLQWREKRQRKHLFTHVEWRMTGYILTAAGTGDFRWAKAGELAVPSAFKGFLE